MIDQVTSALGLSLPHQLDGNQALAASLCIAAAFIGGSMMGRWIGPLIAGWWERRVGNRVEGMTARLCAIVRYATGWLILAIVLAAYPWSSLAAFAIGIPAAAAAALAVANIARGFLAARILAWALATVVFVAVLTDAVGGFAMMSDTLEAVGVMIGSRRISLLDVIQIAVSLLVLYLLIRIAHRIIGETLRRNAALDPTQRLLAEKLANIAILIVAFFVALNLTGIDLTTLAVFSGAFGLALGFGLQKTVGNLFAGIILLMDRSIKPGDVIAVGDSFGSVNKIGVRAVSVITRDGKEHLIPNEDLMTREVENWSHSSPEVRVHIRIGVSYDSDLALAQRLMIEAAEASDRVLASPKPNVWLRGFNEGRADHDILVWIADPEKGVGNVQSEILNRLWLMFKEHGIALPHPQRDLWIRQWPDGLPSPDQSQR